MSDRWDLVVLDEVNYAIHFEMLEPEKLLKLIKERPPRLNMILTGRYARPEIIEAADTVTEMTLIKHAFKWDTCTQRYRILNRLQQDKFLYID